MSRLPWMLAVLLLVLALACAGSARAAEQQKESSAKWAAETDCAHKAFEKFPDYTAESNAKRENYRRACLRSRSLPADSGPAAPAGN